jgi:hypothetical protein
MGLGMFNRLFQGALVVQAQIVSKPKEGGAHALKIKAQLIAGWGVG